MKILCCGDQHITDKKPKNRKDDYHQTVMGKFYQEINIAKMSGCAAVILPGDVFDRYNENNLVVQEVIHAIKRSHLHFLVVAGQHDQQFHNSDLKGTALRTLINAGVVTILSAIPCPITNGVEIYGASWNEPIPEIQDKDKANILVIHRMIVDEKLWAQQEGHTFANHILMHHKFDLVVSGDNHQKFTVSKGSQHLVNAGAMMRSNIGQINHEPAVFIYDTCKQTITETLLAIEPFADVMELDRAEREKENNAHLDAFSEAVRNGSGTEHGIKLNFVEALNNFIKKKEVPKAVSDIIEECMV